MTFGVIAIWVVALGALAMCLRRSPSVARRAVQDATGGLGRVLPVMLMALPMAAFVAELIPAGWAETWLGPESGVGGIVLASLAGGLMPGGPFVAFPLVLGFLKAGAGPSQMVALISGWAILGLHRTLAWELPILGGRFILLRLAASFSLPLLAGLAAEAMLPLFPGVAAR
ncbi:hypothetical protein [Falsiroseomonas sp. E2-1-a20]|uniref:hypothetical protein n=1 Tax=Falsiroseomonas sp. E2-1-a20 TaxID=3239300 RepID=UPI003F3F3AE5